MKQKFLRLTRSPTTQWLRLCLVVVLLMTAGCFSIGGDGQDGRVTPTANAPATATTNATPTVRFETQTTNGRIVTVQSVFLPQDGYVAIHDTTQQNGTGSVIGVSSYLKAGSHQNVTVQLFRLPSNLTPRTLQRNRTLVAVPHRETTGDQTFDFVTTNTREDDPYRVNESPVIDTAFIIVHGHANITATPQTNARYHNDERHNRAALPHANPNSG